jgi:hypothetical protein
LQFAQALARIIAFAAQSVDLFTVFGAGLQLGLIRLGGQRVSSGVALLDF